MLFLQIRQGSIFFSVMAAIIFGFFALSNVALGQDSLRESVYGKSKRNSSSSDKTNSQRKAETTVKKNSSRSTAKTYVSPPPKAAAKALTVTFIATEPMVEVWLDSKNLGVTDSKSKFLTKLAPGEYTLMAKSRKNIFLKTTKITVAPDQTSFDLFEETTSKKAFNISPSVNPENQLPMTPEVLTDRLEGKSDSELAQEISAEIKRILQDYENPATTDSLSEDDWQVVFRAAQLGQLQNFTAVQIEAQRWFASGQIELAQKEYANALTAFNKAQEYMPASALPLYGLGETYLANNQLTDAFKCYSKVLQINPQFSMAYKKLGDVQRLLGKEKDAINSYRKAVQFGYGTPETRYQLANLLLDSKQTQEAVQQLEAVAKEMPTAPVFISIGTGYEKLNRDVSAIDNYRKAIQYDPGSATAYYKLANVYFEQREFGKAKDAYEKAIEFDPSGKYLDRKTAMKRLNEVSSKLNE